VAVSYLGRGIYDIAEIARLLRRPKTRVGGWARPHRGKRPLLTGELSGLFSFWDLISLRVIAELLDRGVSRDHIAEGAKHLARSLGTNRPFAHKKLATVGRSFFADMAAGWEDAGQGGQLAFQNVVEPLLRPLTFNESDMASVWRPYEHVWINPAVQAGTPCVDGTRVPTQQLASLLLHGQNIAEVDISDIKMVCDDYRLEKEQVEAALEYELTLAA